MMNLKKKYRKKVMERKLGLDGVERRRSMNKEYFQSSIAVKLLNFNEYFQSNIAVKPSWD
jgi:hypothetical protein